MLNGAQTGVYRQLMKCTNGRYDSELEYSDESGYYWFGAIRDFQDIGEAEATRTEKSISALSYHRTG